MFEDSDIVFPSKELLQKGSWKPIVLAPHPDSPERIVVGVVSWTGSDFCCLAANLSKTIRCVFPTSTETIQLAQKSAVETVRQAMVQQGPDALEELEFEFSGLALGPTQTGEATDVTDMARFWLNRIASFHKNTIESASLNEDVEVTDDPVLSPVSNDRLPVLIYNAVEHRSPDIAEFFSNEIRSKARRLPRPAPQKVFIGFAGNGVVANFATLKTTRSRVMVDHIKRLMWDLLRKRDEEVGLLPSERRFEMVVYRRPKDDPELTRAQDNQLEEIIEELTEQGAKDEIGVQSRETVDSIATYLASTEARLAQLRRA